MGRFTIGAIVVIFVVGAIFFAGALLGGGSQMSEGQEAAVVEIESCIAESKDEKDVAEYREDVAACLEKARP
ncbi:hypothetical protein [Rothia halotolerans]|uniref:hypothetical protein n=1 Tax=Rothia halotolerans TaxID=405770 RepID=UPI00101DEEE2|nr:hypothetical protein [Rothia halotolerans]